MSTVAILVRIQLSK